MAENPNIIELTDDTFQAEVYEAEMPVLIDFWAPWCGPCKAMAPMVEKIAAKYEGQIKVCKLDIEQHTAAAQELGIQSIPTFMLFSHGRVLGVVIGTTSQAKLEELIAKS